MSPARRVLILALLLPGSACGGEDWLLGSQHGAIVNGQLYSGHPSVGQILDSQGFACTATLVGKKTVLTAAHCVDAGAAYWVSFEGVEYQVVKAVGHPGYSSWTNYADVAVMILAQAPPVAPSVIATSAPAVGLPLITIGFGCTSEADKDSEYGNKRLAKNTIAAIQGDQFMFTGSSGGVGGTCYGDSGGPAFATMGGQEVQIGVTSWGPAPCGGDNWDARVDLYQDWIRQQAGGDVAVPGPVDAAPPQVSFLEPASGATVPLALTVRASATDDVKVTEVQLLVDGSPRQSRTEPPYELPIQLTAGPHQLALVALDAAGKRSEARLQVTAGSAGPLPPDPGPQPQPQPGPDHPQNPQVPGGGLGPGAMVPGQEGYTMYGSCSLAPSPTGDLGLLLPALLLLLARRRPAVRSPG